jgi:hypothetical protein
MFSLKYKNIKYSHIYNATVIKRMSPSYCTVCHGAFTESMYDYLCLPYLSELSLSPLPLQERTGKHMITF